MLVGELLLAGQRLAVIAGEFGFLAGSVGASAAETIVRPSTAPLPAARACHAHLGRHPHAGGHPAFLQMVPIAAAVARHRQAGLACPRLATGSDDRGSHGHLGLTRAGVRWRARALAGFLGPRVYEAVFSRGFPTGVRVTENLVRVGVIDAVVPQEELREWVRRVLAVVATRANPIRPQAPVPADLRPPDPPGPGASTIPDAWDCVCYQGIQGAPASGGSSLPPPRM